MSVFLIRKLKDKDFSIWKDFRLQSLIDEDENFASSFEEENKWANIAFKKILNENDIFCIFIENEIASSISLKIMDQEKMKHRSIIWGLYTKPCFRGFGYADILLKIIISYAKLKKNIEQINLHCASINKSAIKLYEKNGFKYCGEEINALKLKDKYINGYMMYLDLVKK
jgi:RimJ/RimL family protein N-acetyltransferase